MYEQEILLRLTEIENLLRERQTNLLNLNQAAQYLSISHSQLYKYTSQRKIPFHKPAGKYLYFFKHELDQWIRRNDKQNPRVEDQSEGLLSERSENQLEMFEEKEEDESEPP